MRIIHRRDAENAEKSNNVSKKTKGKREIWPQIFTDKVMKKKKINNHIKPLPGQKAPRTRRAQREKL